MASHDRVFLDRVCAVIVDLDASHFGVDGDGSNRYAGGFSDYLEHKQLARRRWEQAFLDQQDELNALRRATRTTARSVSPHNRPPRDNDKFIHHFKGENVAGTISRRVRNVEQRIEAIEKELVPKPPRPLSFGRALTGEARHQGLAVSVRDLEVDRSAQAGPPRPRGRASTCSSPATTGRASRPCSTSSPGPSSRPRVRRSSGRAGSDGSRRTWCSAIPV